MVGPNESVNRNLLGLSAEDAGIDG
jgi:hypothetical protein